MCPPGRRPGPNGSPRVAAVAKTPDAVAKEILAKLAVTAPGFSLELGTPERKIVDAVAESISEAYVDQYLVGSLLDIDSKAGLELDQWVGIFGFGRLEGRRATGTVRVELSNANAQDITLPRGGQFRSRQVAPTTGEPLAFAATESVVIPAGSLVADVPVECLVPGTAGNVAPDSVTYLGDVMGATSVTNLQGFVGGVNPENDEELRQRFKDTFLRSVAGTHDWYLGLCLQNKSVSRASCFGAVRKYATQFYLDNGQADLGEHLARDVKYAWDGDCHVSVFKNLGQADETFYRRGVDYEWVAGAQPSVAALPDGDMQDGDVVDLEFEYTSNASRNDPVAGVTNKVDVYVNGSNPQTVTERTVVPSTTLTSVATDQLYAGNFVRVGTTGVPQAGNRFTRLGSVPVVSFPSILTVVAAGTAPVKVNYRQGTDYHLVRPSVAVNPNPTTLLYGSPYEVAGIEWVSASGPAAGTAVTLTYTYNRVPELLQAVLKTSKQISTDVMVHQAAYRWMKVYLSVEYDRGFVPQQVNNVIADRLRDHFANMPFGAWIEVSDLALAVHQVPGVDNVRLTRSTDDGVDAVDDLDYGIKTYAESSDVQHVTDILDSTPGSPTLGRYLPYEDDFKLRDNQLPMFLDVVVRRRANR